MMVYNDKLAFWFWLVGVFIILLWLGAQVPSFGTEYQIIPKGSVWKYLDTGVDLGTTWRTPGFNDSGWSSGSGPLGFGGGETTLLTSGKTTYYFRKSFNVANITTIKSLVINLLRDDGAVVYLNGTEVLRENMSGGTIRATTFAVSSTIASYRNIYFPFSIDTSLLIEGTNVIAVEIHQYSINANLIFDLQLSVFNNYNPVLVSKSAVWKYLANGSDQGTVWRDTSFNDSTWSVGTAEIGFGDTGNNRPEITILTNTQWTTYYFRKAITLSNISCYKYLQLSVLRDDGAVVYINGIEVWRTNMNSGPVFAYSTASANVAGDDEAIFFTTSIGTSTLVEGTNIIAVEVHQILANPSGDVGFDLQLIGFDYEPLTGVFIETGAMWKYLEDGTDQGTTWRAITFDDSTWSTGQAELGFGDGPVNGRPEATTFIPTHQNFTTYYFRKSFTVENAESYASLTAYILRDDGAVVYLNDTEVFRSNMPSGPVFSYTTALSNVAGADETTYFAYSIDPSLLVEGTNVLAVEVHQMNFVAPTDLSFDLELRWYKIPPDPVIAIPIASFSGNPLSGYGPLTIKFTSNCTNMPTKWIWSFGDGSCSNLQNPQHIYGIVSAPTTYTVRLIAGNPFGDATTTTPEYVFVTEPAPLPPEVLTPINNITTHNHQPLFSWNAALGYGTKKYTLELANDIGFSSVITTITNISTTNYTPLIPLSNGEFYWRVQASSPFGNSDYSASRYIIVFDTADRRVITGCVTTRFHLGTWSGATEYYTPVTLSVNSIGLGATDTVTIMVYDGKHPQATDSTGKLGDRYFISRWWDISSNGTIQLADILFTYTDDDFGDANIGGMYTEADLEIARWNGVWSWPSLPITRDTGANWINIHGVSSFSSWTLSGPGGVPVELSKFTTE